MADLEHVWQKVNQTRSLKELANVIRTIDDFKGNVFTTEHKAETQALIVEAYIPYAERKETIDIPNRRLTRAFGIRQQAFYLVTLNRT